MIPSRDTTVKRILHRDTSDLREVPKGTPGRFRGKLWRRCCPDECNLAKIIVVSLLLLFLGVAVMRRVLNSREIKPYRPQANHFAISLSPYVVPGYRTVPHGRSACKIRTPPISERECRQLVYFAESSFNETIQKQGIKLEELQKQHDHASFVDDKMMLGMRPLRLANYKKALEYAEKAIVYRKYAFQNPENTLSLIKTLHRILAEGLPPNYPPGVYRNYWNSITYFAGPLYAELTLNEIKRVGSEQEIEIYQNALSKFKDGIHEGLRRLSEEELAVFKKVMIICPSPEQIEPEMQKFVFTLKELEANRTASIDMGCFAHGEVGRIHPFSDSHGRLGRVLLLALLKRGGEGEMVIPDKGLYGQASLDEMKYPGTFKRYVIETLAWTKNHRQALDLIVTDT